MDMGDHAAMAHGADDHMHMDHGMAMDMAPDGIALAEGASDRDGLELDVLHLRYGPVTRYWPAGLILRCTLHGDVIGHAEVELIASRTPVRHEETDSPGMRSAWWCDHVTTVLALAGSADAAGRIRCVRDSFLTGQDDRAAEALSGLARRIRRSRVLRWALRDLGVLTAGELRRSSLDRAGDVWDRLQAMLDHAEQAVPPGTTTQPADVIEIVPRLVSGLDLTTARLVVASLCLDPVVTVGAQS
jgi:hypothetical protein